MPKTKPTTKPASRLLAKDTKALYLCDGGQILCGLHLGVTAAYSGRDISGQEVIFLDEPNLKYLREEVGSEASCEGCDHA